MQKKITPKIFFYLLKKLTLKTLFITQCNFKEYMITIFHKLVTSYGNVKSEIQLKLVFIVVGLQMYLATRSSNQSDKKSHFKFLQKGEEQI